MSSNKYIDRTGRIFYPHYMWEDYVAGFYDRQSIEEQKVKQCISLLSDQDYFWDVMCQLEIDWKHCFEYNLSNRTHNRKAWLGQVSCCYEFGVSFNVTIEAWNKLCKETQIEANYTAQRMIDLFERKNNGKDIFKAECARSRPRS